MKKLFLSIIILSLSAFGQNNSGIEVGLAQTGFASLLSHNGSNKIKPSVTIFTDVEVSRLITLSPRIGFSMRGGELTPLALPAIASPQVNKNEYSLNYIDASILATSSYQLEDDAIILSVYAGPVVSYLLSGKVKQHFTMGSPSIENDVSGLSEVSFGLFYGTAFGIQAPGGMLEFKFNVYTQFNSSTEANSGLSLKNFSEGLSISYRIDLSRD